jgi:hypothetical protein
MEGMKVGPNVEMYMKLVGQENVRATVRNTSEENPEE